MGCKYLAFDLEIAKEIPDGELGSRAHRPLGISCAATLPSNFDNPLPWYGLTSDSHPTDRMTQQDARHLVQYLVTMNREGFTILTWNGLGFDFDILTEESGMYEECKHMALDQVDMMFHVFCELGPYSIRTSREWDGISGKTRGDERSNSPASLGPGPPQSGT